MFYYYPYNKDKVCIFYPPAEPKHVKTKIGNALWNDLKVHCFREKEQNFPVTTGNDDNYMSVCNVQKFYRKNLNTLWTTISYQL